MAIIQISRIIQRSGNLVDLPQLAEAELGWANDARRLFVGRGGEYDAENVEVLTSYSDISFGQIEGSYGNLDFSVPVEGQIISYNKNSNTWVNTGGNALSPGNVAEYSNNLVHLGDVGYVKLGGGSLGYVLETDGQGNLIWGTKGTLRNQIIALSNSTPVIIQIDANAPYVNGLEITISGANATNANTILNGQNFYVSVANDFPVTGNVSLYNDSGLTSPLDGSTLGVYTANSGIATALLSSASGGSGIAGGAEGSIQFNQGGFSNGAAQLTWNTTTNLLNVSGNANISGTANVSALSATGVVRGSQLVSTAISPTAPIVVSSSVRIPNANVQTAGNLINGTSNVIVNTNGNIVLGVAGTANVATFTSAGISITGNANVGNLNASGRITATGNANLGNLGTSGVFAVTLSATGNAQASGNLIVGGNANISGNIGTSYIFAIGLSATGAIQGSSTLSAIGNANVGNLGTAGLISAAGDVTGSIINSTNNGNGTNFKVGDNAWIGDVNVSDTISIRGQQNGANAFIVFGNADNTTTIGRAGSGPITVKGAFSVTGNANIGNIGTAGLITATGNVQGGNLRTTGILSVGGNANVGNIGATNGVFTNVSGNGSRLSSITGANVTGIVANANYAAFTGNVSFASTAGTATTAGTVTTNAQPNITSVGTLSSLRVNGTANVNNFQIATRSGTTSLGSRLYGNSDPSIGDNFWVGLEGNRTEPRALGIGIGSSTTLGAGVVDSIAMLTDGSYRISIKRDGNVGINTTNPNSSLHSYRDGSSLLLEGAGTTFAEFYPRGLGSGRKAWMGYGSSGTTQFTLSQEDTGILNLMNSGTAVWIDRNPAAGVAIVVDGVSRFQISNTATVTNLNMFAPNFYSTSDIKLKKDISTIVNALDKVEKLRGVNYKLIENDKPQIGLIAQEVEEVIPEIVESLDDTKRIDYGKMAGLFVEAIKELKKEIVELKKEINELRKK